MSALKARQVVRVLGPAGRLLVPDQVFESEEEERHQGVRRFEGDGDTRAHGSAKRTPVLHHRATRDTEE